MLKDYFIKQAIKEVEIEEFIRKNFPLGDYSKTELQRTPLGIKIVIYTNKPGRIIGRGGKNINDMTEALRVRFKLENPQLDVKTIENPNLDAKIVAKQIASALEKGYNHKKIGNLTIKRVMESGAIGIQIIIAGKFTGSKTMTAKFVEGYVKHAGHLVDELVDEGFEEALTRPGKIGVRVRIVKEFEDITGERRRTVERVRKPQAAAGEAKAEAQAIDAEQAMPEMPAETAVEKPKRAKSPKTAKPKTDRPGKKPRAKKAAGDASKEAANPQKPESGAGSESASAA